MEKQRNNQELDQIIQDFFDIEVTKLMATIYRRPKRTTYNIIKDAEQTQANNAFNNRMYKYAEEYLTTHTTAYTHGEITHVLLEEKFRRGHLISLILRHGGQIMTNNLEDILRGMGVDVPHEEPIKDHLHNYKPTISVEDQLAIRRKRLEAQGHTIKPQEEKAESDDENDGKDI